MSDTTVTLDQDETPQNGKDVNVLYEASDRTIRVIYRDTDDDYGVIGSSVTVSSKTHTTTDVDGQTTVPAGYELADG